MQELLSAHVRCRVIGQANTVIISRNPLNPSSMPQARMHLIASPIPGGLHDLECDRTAQVIESIRVARSACWIGWERQASDAPHESLQPNYCLQNPWAGLGLSRTELSAVRDIVDCHILTPILHGRPDLMNYDDEAYRIFLDANHRLACGLKHFLRDDDIIWVHDYLHAPLAESLREAGFPGPLGFTLHAPFPAPEILEALPRQAQFLKSLCRFNLLGFQSRNCLQNFEQAAEATLNASLHATGLTGPHGEVATGVFPIPIDVAKIRRVAAAPIVEHEEAKLRAYFPDGNLIGSWGTLDPTQGIVERLRSFELFLKARKERFGRDIMIQAIVPQRSWLEESQDVRSEVEIEFSRINGRFSTLDWTPIRYFHGALPPSLLAALYRVCRVGLITPFSEGMSLTAKDFVVMQRPEDPGVLILSQFARVAEELDGALIVNPFEIERVAEALGRAVEMPLAERQARWESMNRILEASSVDAWSSRFIERLADLTGGEWKSSAA